MKTRSALLLPLIAGWVIAVVSWSGVAQAQNSAGSGQQASPQTQQPPDTQAPAPDGQSPAQTSPRSPAQTQPDPNADPGQTRDQTQSDTGTNEYLGTVVKQGNKYVFQESGTGAIYDIDHQDEVSKFEGKKVRVHGVLDPKTKMIHVQ